jgi:hypothetical protein
VADLTVANSVAALILFTVASATTVTAVVLYRATIG